MYQEIFRKTNEINNQSQVYDMIHLDYRFQDHLSIYYMKSNILYIIFLF